MRARFALICPDRTFAALQAQVGPREQVPHFLVCRLGEVLIPEADRTKRFWRSGANIQGLGISAALAVGVNERVGPLVGIVIAFLGAWILFKTQLDSMEGMVRAITDMLWTGSDRVRAWRGGDVRTVYYGVLAVVVLWGIAAMGVAQPIFLLKLGGTFAGVVLIVASLHLLYINTRLLPQHVRPPLWRRAALIGTAIFYGFFVSLSVYSLVSSKAV